MEDDPLVDPLRSVAAAKAAGEILPEPKNKGQRATTADQVIAKQDIKKLRKKRRGGATSLRLSKLRKGSTELEGLVKPRKARMP